jgi:hypothetical protein
MKDKNLLIKRIAQITGWIAIIVSTVLAVMFYINIKDPKALDYYIDILMNWTVIMAVLALIVAFVVGPILSMIANPKSLVKGLVSVGVLVIIFILGYSLSKGDVSTVHLNITVKNLQTKLIMTETGLISTYIIAGITVLAVIVAEVRNIFK